MIRILGSLIGPVIVCALAWAGGFDFNVRGQTAFFTVLISIFSYLYMLFCPYWCYVEQWIRGEGE